MELHPPLHLGVVVVIEKGAFGSLLTEVANDNFYFINTPSILTDQLLVLEAATTSLMVRVNLNALDVVK